MVLSISLNGKTLGQTTVHLEKHIMRNREMSGGEIKNIKNATKSHINPALTAMNVPLVDELSSKEIRDLYEEHMQARDNAGDQGIMTKNTKGKEVKMKRGNKNTKACSAFTLQLSNTTLLKLGWRALNVKGSDDLDDLDDDEDKIQMLPANMQDDDVLENVTEIYKTMLKAVQDSPEIYGNVAFASIHFDESSPHVDGVLQQTDGKDPYRDVRSYMTGPTTEHKGPRGKLHRMQDVLATNFQKEFIKSAGVPEKVAIDKIKELELTRGEKRSKSEKLRNKERRLERLRKELKNNENALKEQKIAFEREMEQERAELKEKKHVLESEIQDRAKFMRKMMIKSVEYLEPTDEQLKTLRTQKLGAIGPTLSDIVTSASVKNIQRQVTRNQRIQNLNISKSSKRKTTEKDITD